MDRWDVVVIGAGPAGLAAALYLARFRRSVLVLHDGQSRALHIPRTHNAPGFPDGISGPELIDRMTVHATVFGAVIDQAWVTHAEHSADGFRLASKDGREWTARAILLATGVRMNQVDLSPDEHQLAIDTGVLRYCPICDGFEHIDARIGVIGCDTNGAAEALFLREYSSDVTLMPLSHAELEEDQVAELEHAGIAVLAGALEHLRPGDDQMLVKLEGQSGATAFDVVYPALGMRPRTRLARMLGITPDEHGCLSPVMLDGEPRPGLFAAGDVIAGLDQISVAIGHGALAATRAHNWLRDMDRHSLQAR